MAGALRQLETLAQKKLGELRVQYKEIEVLATPRRLVLIFAPDAWQMQADMQSENKGAFFENCL